jgi:hypothetical protein
MTTPADILIRIAEGRLAVERTVAFSLSQTLAEVEVMVRKLRQTEAPDVTADLADLADLEAMRDILDGADWPPTPLGLSEALKRAEEADELDRRHAGALATISDLRAQIAALTPGPWVRLGDVAPKQCEIVMMFAGVVGGAPWLQLISETTVQCMPVGYFWRRLPAGLLDVPAPTVAP